MKRGIFILSIICSFFISKTIPIYACDPTIPGVCPNGVCTALGCVPTDQNLFVGTILNWAIMAGGGIAFLLMIFGGFGIITSSGNPEGVKKGSETITSALMGLVFIVLALFLLHFIGVKLFVIPGF
jgi:hypothetical protein